MEIRILGSVHIRVNGVPVELRSEKTRSLLALLAQQPNEYLSDAFVIDRIWEEELPVRPRDALYTCASRLRHAFGEGTHHLPGEVVRRSRGGYLLNVPPHTIDLHRFRSLARSARDAVRRGSRGATTEEALSLLDDALALWRGTPMSDLQSSWSARARLTLEQELLSARIDRAQLAMRLGRQRETVPALYELAEEHPLDETVTALLMEALYRSGRQNESLACFTTIHHRLVLELGDGPGFALHELHGRILRRDPTLQCTNEPKETKSRTLQYSHLNLI
ncbi:AfsR/SARP family transcriptional regulator [Streptomyces paludis]|uniref:AfsR/SARP family transcriptional regulator n=1 Tax=Streptomyces paludis TaxID=2282738 RepID=A0A345HNW7_9ACTN|nr:AfsR/SARP family transcriptional regulator [Streptomyces paludis]AXG78391.1 AfsR/SARP family transcriptional regulator [Streptomyces paludis]